MFSQFTYKLSRLEKPMPHWTPECSDEVVVILNKSLWVGDQQTYAIMTNLKNKYPDQYPIPGDWHIMKTAAEVIKGVINDGGFKVFADKCGHKG